MVPTGQIRNTRIKPETILIDVFIHAEERRRELKAKEEISTNARLMARRIGGSVFGA